MNILEALEQGKTVTVENIWSFYGTNMSCWQGCCQEDYDSLEEAADAVMFFAEDDLDIIEIES